MEQMYGNELRYTLIERNLIDESGAVNAFTVNCISGAHTWPLLSEVWDLYLHDTDVMVNLQTFLNELYENEQCKIMIGVLKICYNFCSLLIPDEVQMIFDCNEEKLKKTYLYEFLADFQDIMYDFME